MKQQKDDRADDGGGMDSGSTARQRWQSEFSDILMVEDRYYILATSSLADENSRVLKHGETFGVFDRYGDIKPVGLGEEGIYHEGTRFLSALFLRLGTERPLFLTSTVKEDNAVLSVDLTNPDIATSGGGHIAIPRGTLHILRTRFLWKATCYERVRVRNYGAVAIEAVISVLYHADFVDIFEVRGLTRAERGRALPAWTSAGRAVLSYEGLDGFVRRTSLRFSPDPERVTPSQADFRITLEPGAETVLDVTITCDTGETVTASTPRETALTEAAEAHRAFRARTCDIHTSNEMFNEWLNRSMSDVAMMLTDTDGGPYPYAGVPWFSTPFGRDAIITALECLWIDPSIARGVLAFLAEHQATDTNPEQDSEPGKILHEMRRGEMAALGEIPFGRYYGSVDSTPLFVVLAGAWFERTGDVEFLVRLWPHIERALEWIDFRGDVDGDGLVEYQRRSSEGLVQQGWKDSQDSVFHHDGRLAEGPIALCEVQGYVHAARESAAAMARALGLPGRAHELRRSAAVLRARFEKTFWCEDLSTYALALDGAKRPCRVRASNAGHCLFAGIADPARARRTASTLLSEDCFSGWGIRTLAASEARYNPMSYHNGSIWPHDNALISHGFARYGLKDAAIRVLTGLFDASLFMDQQRLPELFCGFPRRPGSSPTLYPVACSPQSWAAASVFMLLQACLGLTIQAEQRQVVFSQPVLPGYLDRLRIRNLRVGDAVLDLLLERYEQDVGINVTRREGDLRVIVIK